MSSFLKNCKPTLILKIICEILHSIAPLNLSYKMTGKFKNGLTLSFKNQTTRK